MRIYDLDDAELTRRINKEWKDARSSQADWRKEAVEDFNFPAGHQWDEDDITKLKEEGRPVVTFNRCNPILSAIMGMEANQRQETKYLPRENSDSPIADATTQIVNWIRDYGEIDVEDSMSFENMLTCGMGWSECLMNYDVDLDGKICLESVPSLEMAWDQTAIKRNLIDAKWVARGKKMTPEEISERWPDKEIEISGDTEDDNVGNLHVNNAPHYYEEEGTQDNTTSKQKTIIHFSWYEAVPIHRAANPQTGRIESLSHEEFTAKENKDKIAVLQQNGINFVQQFERKYYYAFVFGNVMLEKGEAPCQTGLHYKCMTGKRDHIKNAWYGIVRMMKDPQRWANKFFSQFMDIIAANAKGGLIMESDAVEDIRKFEKNYAKVDSIAVVNPGTLQRGAVQPKPPVQYPNSTDRLMQMSISAIYEVTGVNLELLGIADREQAGIVEESRKKSGYTILAPYFDSLKSFRKETGLALLEYVIKFMPVGRMQQVLEPELAPLADQIKQLDTRQINVVVAESPQSDNNKLITWQFMSQMLPVLLKMGVPIPPEVIEYSPLPATLASKWSNMLKQAQQQAQSPEAQMQKKMMVAEKLADLQNKSTKSELDQAKAQTEKATAAQKIQEVVTGRNVFGP